MTRTTIPAFGLPADFHEVSATRYRERLAELSENNLTGTPVYKFVRQALKDHETCCRPSWLRKQKALN